MYIDLGKILQKPKTDKNPKGEGHYMKITEDVTIRITGTSFKGEKIDRILKQGDFLNIDDEEDRIRRMYKNQPEKLEERLKQLPEWVKYHISIPPVQGAKEEPEQKAESVQAKKSFRKEKKSA